MAKDKVTSYELPGGVKAASAPDKPKGKPKITSVTVRKLDKGFTVRCEHGVELGGPYMPSKEYAFSSLDDAFKFAAEKMGSSVGDDE